MTDRELAYRALCEIDLDGRLLHAVLKETLDGAGAENNRAFVSRLVRGVTERKLTLEYLLVQQSGRRLKDIKPRIRIIISMGMYQLMFMKTYASAAVNESVKLARKHGMSGLSGFVNAVLRGFVRKLEEKGLDCDTGFGAGELLKLYEGSEDKKLSYLSSTPVEIIEVLEKYLGKEEAESILMSSLSEENILTVYRLGSACDEQEFEKTLAADGITFSKINDEGLRNAYELSGAGNITAAKAFRQGMFIVQNISSMLASEAVPVKEGMKVLDVCAAPGGKAVHLADRIKAADGHVTACDISEAKTEKITETAERVGLDNIKVCVCDAEKPNQDFFNAFDVLVCDLPCSGLGVIAGKPDIKYKTKPADIEALSQIQRRILDNVSNYLKKGGYMVYSTCTLTRQENEDNTEYIKAMGYEEEKSMRLLPDRARDGFYISVLRKL